MYIASYRSCDSLVKPGSHCADLEVPISTTWKSWRTAWSARKDTATSYEHFWNLYGRERTGSDQEVSRTVLNCETLSYWLWLQPWYGIKSDEAWPGRVHDQENRGPVVPSMWAAVDSVWAVMKIVSIEPWQSAWLALNSCYQIYNSYKDVHVYMCVDMFILLLWICPQTEEDNAILLRKSRSNYNCGKWK